MPWYSFKVQTREYLQEINRESKVLEYCLFQPGLFTNYLTHPYKSTTHVKDIETPFDFGNRRMIVCNSSDDQKITFTTVRDLANTVALAVEYAGEWPVIGGIKGSDLSFGQLITLGEELRGKFPRPRIPSAIIDGRADDLLQGLWLSTKWSQTSCRRGLGAARGFLRWNIRLFHLRKSSQPRGLLRPESSWLLRQEHSSQTTSGILCCRTINSRTRRASCGRRGMESRDRRVGTD